MVVLYIEKALCSTENICAISQCVFKFLGGGIGRIGESSERDHAAKADISKKAYIKRVRLCITKKRESLGYLFRESECVAQEVCGSCRDTVERWALFSRKSKKGFHYFIYGSVSSAGSDHVEITDILGSYPGAIALSFRQHQSGVV